MSTKKAAAKRVRSGKAKMKPELTENLVKKPRVKARRGIEYYQDKDGLWRWRLRAENHEIVADSAEGYYSKSMATKGARAAEEEFLRISDARVSRELHRTLPF
jgi:uncharacterized protein YegP (UPF0339 family)